MASASRRQELIVLPTAGQLAAATAAFDQDWGAVDDVLYQLCREHPDHADRRIVTAKLALIGRAYSAGLERRVSPPKGQQAITVIAEFVHAHHAEADAIIKDLAVVQEPLTAQAMRGIVGFHGRFTKLLREVTTDGKAPRSFAAKYLHFHRPVVPIYDSYAAVGAGKLVRWDSKNLPFARPDDGDPDYYDFCVRFWRLYEACRQAGLDVTVKTLDHCLWAVPA